MCTTFNILNMDGSAFRRWAQLMHRQSNTLYEDAMIAAIAKVHQLTVVTSNVVDFNGFDVPCSIHLRAARRISDKKTGVKRAAHEATGRIRAQGKRSRLNAFGELRLRAPGIAG